MPTPAAPAAASLNRVQDSATSSTGVAAATEWLLGNGLGGFAMGTACGVPTRRYHALLVAPSKPPTARFTTLRAIDLRLHTRGPGEAWQTHFGLSPLWFAGSPAPAELTRPVDAADPAGFARSASAVRWTHELATGAGAVRLTRSVTMLEGENTVVLGFAVGPSAAEWRLEVRPLVTCIDFHHLLRREDSGPAHESGRFAVRQLTGPEARVIVASRAAGVMFTGSGAAFSARPESWHNLFYEREADRGQDCVESAFCPGVFAWSGGASAGVAEVELHASAEAMPATVAGALGDRGGASRAARRSRLIAMGDRVLAALDASLLTADRERAVRSLVEASDAFVVRRASPIDGSPRASIVAGYPWFADWGRDSMISLPGLLLTTGRHDEAFDVLHTFAHLRTRGLIPNHFDDSGRGAHYNTADAPLWFVHAAAEYLRASGDRARFDEFLAPACRDVVKWYTSGTDGPIAVDPGDGLLMAGSPETQLTWMDAKRDGIAFTPRFGKAVELNALWVNALRLTAELATPRAEVTRLTLAADRAAASFQRVFVRPDGLGLYDRLEPTPGPNGTTWRPIVETRPNQVLAAALPHAPLTAAQRRAVLRTAAERLLTPVGLRTLDPGHPGYIPHYAGDMWSRDRSYHNGTVWPWLMGAYCEASLRSAGFAKVARIAVLEALDPLLRLVCTPAAHTHTAPFAGAGLAFGTIPEIFDAEPDARGLHKPDGCPAQAWSVAEVLRAVVLALTRGP